MNANGSFSYTPNPDFNGVDSFTYKANDSSKDSDEATVTITVNSVNDAPVAFDDSYSVDEDSILNVNEPGILANDTDLEGDTLNAVLVDSTTNGTLTLNANGSFSYTPNPDFNGADSYTYKANDSYDDSNIATVSITVNPVNEIVLTPQEAIEELIDEVENLITEEKLNQGQGNALISKLENIIAKIDKGNIKPAINQLGAFINQVNAFIRGGVLSSEEGQPLIDAANEIIDMLNQ